MENKNPTPNPAPTPEQAPVTPAPAPVQSAPAPTTEVPKQPESSQPAILIRYPNLLVLLLVLRMLAIIFVILGVVIGFLQFFHDTTFLVKIGYFFLYIMLGTFSGVVCWTLSEAIQVWLDTEAQTRPKEIDDRLKAMLKS